MAHLLGAEALHLEYPTRVVFDSVTLGIEEGDRIGIVGRNGDGKSSLLGMLAGIKEPNSGRVTVRGGTRIGVLDQADNLPDDLTISAAVVGDTPEYEWAGDARVRDVIEGLLTDLPWDAEIGSLSGGQRRRVSLAKLLTGDWDVIALDEPTNHLDVEAITWLAGHLKKRWSPSSGALMVVTHDRWFLDEISTETWEVHDRIVEPFEGGYAAYILQRVERDRMASATEAKRQNLAKKELAWLRRGAPARTAKPKFRIDAANELIADVPEIRDKVSLQSLAVSRLGKDVVDLLDVGVTYPAADGGEKVVLRDIEWRIAPGERTGILGVNGAGKSTLLGLISGTVEPTVGRVKRGTTVKVQTLTQRLDELTQHWNDPVRVIISGLRTSYTMGAGSKAQDLTPGQLLERLGFDSAQLSTPVKDLSGVSSAGCSCCWCCSTSRTCSSSTSRPTTSTPTCSPRSKTFSTPGRARCWSSATTGTSWSASPTSSTRSSTGICAISPAGSTSTCGCATCRPPRDRSRPRPQRRRRRQRPRAWTAQLSAPLRRRSQPSSGAFRSSHSR
jgi:ATP-binding cassette subfamily F protein uup